MDYRKWAKYPDWHPVHPANRKQDKTKLTLNDNGTLTEIETADRILIHENIQEIEHITSDIEMRCSMLNSISKHGLSAEEIRNVSSSKTAIDNFIEGHLQKENPEYARMKQAGITAKLSDQLQDLKDALLRLEAINPGREVINSRI